MADQVDWRCPPDVRLLVNGDWKAGKTFLIESFVYNKPLSNEVYETTYEVINYRTKVGNMTIEIHDTPDVEHSMAVNFYREMDAIIACFPVVSYRGKSFESLYKWISIGKRDCEGTPRFIVGTKSDLRGQGSSNDREISIKEAQEFCEKEGAAGKYLECSAYTLEGVHEVFSHIISTTLASKKLSAPELYFAFGMREGYVYLTTKKLVLMGPPCVGKTAFKALLFNWPAPKHHHSTAIASRPVRAIERVTDRNEGKVWDLIQSKQMLETLTDAVNAFDFDKVEKDVPHFENNIISNDMPLENITETDHDPRTATDDNESIKDVKTTPNLSVPSIKSSTDPSKLLMELNKKPEKTKKSNKLHEATKTKKSNKLHEATWVHVLDSGGQPQFADISRAFLRGNAINVIVFRLTEKLSDKPRFTYSLNGKVMNTPSELQMTNIQLIEHFVRSVASSKSTTVTFGDDKVVSKPFFILIGTYYDEVTKGIFKKKEITEETIADKNRQILSSLYEFRDQFIFFNQSSDELIFPVDNLCRLNRAKISAQIREHIMSQEGVGFKVPVPIRWYMFELHIKEIASSSEHGMISLKSCYEIGTKLDMSNDDVKASLAYFDSLTIYIYYEKLLPNVIFTNPQYLLDMLSNIVRVSFVKIQQEDILPKGNVLSLETQRLLCEDGIFEESLLDTLGLPFVPSLFNKSDFIRLLRYISVIVPIDSPDPIRRYFMPVVLSNDSLTTEQKQIFTTSIEPLVITFNSKLVLQGLFPTLIVTLLSRKEEPRFFIDSRSDNFPRQLRHAIKLYSDDLFGSVFLCDEYNCIEVYFTGRSRYCYILRKVILQALTTSANILAYDVESLNISALVRCNRKHISPLNDTKPHSVTISYQENPPIIGCSIEDLPVIELTDVKQKCWLLEPLEASTMSLNMSDVQVRPEGKLGEEHAPLLLKTLRDLVEWEYIGTLLGLKDSVLKEIKYNNHHQLHTCRKDMIVTWLQGDNATRPDLISALETIGRNDLVYKLTHL